MAIDTREKRFSIMGTRSHPLQGTTQPLFEADGTVDQDDRAHLLGLYSGFRPSGAFFARYYYDELLAEQV